MITRKNLFLMLPLLIIIAFVLFFPFKQVIAFYYEDTNQLLAYLPLAKNKSFQIKYTHSIHLTDVVETYEIEEDSIVLKQLEYENFAIGMPANAEGNETFVHKDGKYLITNMERVFPSIDLRIGQIRADHRLIYNEHVFTLSNSLNGGTWVRIQPMKLSIWQQLKGVNINE